MHRSINNKYSIISCNSHFSKEKQNTFANNLLVCTHKLSVIACNFIDIYGQFDLKKIHL